jgi:hypothetical protein
METVFTHFEIENASGMAGLLVRAFYDVSDEVAHDPVVKAEWDRWRAFFRSLTAKTCVDLIETSSDVKRDIRRSLNQIELSIDSTGLFVEVRWNTKASGCFMSFYYVPALKKIKSTLKTGAKDAFRGGKNVDDPHAVYSEVKHRADLESFMGRLMQDVCGVTTESFSWHLMRTFYKD